ENGVAPDDVSRGEERLALWVVLGSLTLPVCVVDDGLQILHGRAVGARRREGSAVLRPGRVRGSRACGHREGDEGEARSCEPTHAIHSHWRLHSTGTDPVASGHGGSLPKG